MIGFGLTIGAGAGSIRTLEAATVPRVFGTAHLGAIRGLLALFSVGSTVFGPVLFAVAGSRPAVTVLCSRLPLLVALAALWVRPPGIPNAAG